MFEDTTDSELTSLHELIRLCKMQYIKNVLENGIALRKLTKLEIVQPHQNYLLRPQQHVLLVGPFGLGKSSLWKSLRTQLKEGKDCEYITDYSYPGIVGTISKAGEFIPGKISRAGGKIIFIDEFQKLSGSAKNALLSLLEDQYFQRALGFKVQTPVRKYSKYMRYSASENEFTIETNFTCFASSMWFFKNYSHYGYQQMAKGLLSRFVPIFMAHAYSDIYDDANRKNVPRPDVFDTSVEHVIIDWDLYQRIVYEHRLLTSQLSLVKGMQQSDLGFLKRSIADVVRHITARWIKINEMMKTRSTSRTFFSDIDIKNFERESEKESTLIIERGQGRRISPVRAKVSKNGKEMKLLYKPIPGYQKQFSVITPSIGSVASIALWFYTHSNLTQTEFKVLPLLIEEPDISNEKLAEKVDIRPSYAEKLKSSLKRDEIYTAIRDLKRMYPNIQWDEEMLTIQ